MSITTLGWGSTAITTVGFGATAEVAAPPAFVPSRRTSPLALQLKLLMACKIDDVDWQAGVATRSATLTTLESELSRIRGILWQIENTDPLVVQLKQLMACKINQTDWDDGLAAADVTLDTHEATLNRLKSLMEQFQLKLRLHAAANRGNC